MQSWIKGFIGGFGEQLVEQFGSFAGTFTASFVLGLIQGLAQYGKLKILSALKIAFVVTFSLGVIMLALGKFSNSGTDAVSLPPEPPANTEIIQPEYSENVKNLMKRASAGFVFDQWRLGMHYENGLDGLPVDYGEAFYWYQKAALRGDEGAQYALGRFYEFGLGVPRNINAAIVWYRKAAAQGSRSAREALARISS